MIDCGFDFHTAVSAPFRMQPGLRRLAPGARHLTPLPPGCAHQREKLAVLSAFWQEALVCAPGFEGQETAALHALCAHAAREHPQHFEFTSSAAATLHSQASGRASGISGIGGISGISAISASVPSLGVRLRLTDGAVLPLGSSSFGLGDEAGRCLSALPPHWRLAGLLSLAFAEDLALLDARDASVPWMAVCLPSHWAPHEKVGLSFAAIHAPVADNRLLLQAAPALVRTISNGQAWERFVWTITDHPRLHAHPERVLRPRWQGAWGVSGQEARQAVSRAWFRSERQTLFTPVAEVAKPDAAHVGKAAHAQPYTVFTIGIGVQALAEVAQEPARAGALHAAVASMSPDVLAYRNLHAVREPLLAWLAEQAGLGA